MVSPAFLFEVIMLIDILEDNINITSLLQEANGVKQFLSLGWRDVSQIGLQGHKPNLNPVDEWKASIERTTKLQYPETYFRHLLFDLPIINRFIEKYGLVRTRLINNNSQKCDIIQQGMTKSIHIPLISNPNCFIVIDNQMFYLEPGKIYLTNTTRKHTYMNASSSPRIHITGCLYS
jgi:hypothetical protein|tara:strand:+ start:364 stop:894 length:531 start_codon:yes stop_codon:yes gene_type:complete